MSQKLENQLQLALETPEGVRIQTEDLNVGYETVQRTWELIVKYHGSLEQAIQRGAVAEELIAGYAILTIPENKVEEIAALEEIEYMEKPKRFYYNQILPREGSCIYPVTLQDPFLTGRGVLAAVLDSGIAYDRREFRTQNGESRILFLWDQTLRPSESMNSPSGFEQGVEFSREQINGAILESEEAGMWITGPASLVPSRDISGHGTAVSGIFAASNMTANMADDMAGNFVDNARKDVPTYVGIAPESDLLVVKLGIPGENAFPRTTEIMRGVTYVINKAVELQRPVVINLSIGNTYGSHDGSSLLERFLDNASEIGRTVICVGSGNEGDSAGHVFGNVRDRQIVEWTVGEYERNLSLQIWKNYSDVYRITLRSPGNEAEVISEQIEAGKYEIILEQTRILVYVGEPTPYSANQEIYLEFLPVEGTGGGQGGGILSGTGGIGAGGSGTNAIGAGRTGTVGQFAGGALGLSTNNYINSGIWQIQLEPIRTVTGEYSLYLPSREARNSRTAFLRPTPQATFTIPSTASKTITVGAYDSTYNAYADFSGRGYEDTDMIARFAKGYGKPDIAAPGVGVLAPSIYGGFEAFTGTSFATPIVAGAAALLMEWGIVRGNDPYMYGEKVKAYLIRGARELPGFRIYPNAQVGWGKLCLENSLPL